MSPITTRMSSAKILFFVSLLFVEVHERSIPTRFLIRMLEPYYLKALQYLLSRVFQYWKLQHKVMSVEWQIII